MPHENILPTKISRITVYRLHYTTAAPQFKQSILYNNDGMLELEWTLRHTGGVPLHSISVTCSGGNSTTLIYISVCTPDMCGDYGSTRLGPVMAGSSYTCRVTASNAVGNTTSDTNQARRQGGFGGFGRTAHCAWSKHEKLLSALSTHVLHGPHSQNGGVIYSLAYQQSCNRAGGSAPASQAMAGAKIIQCNYIHFLVL